MFAKTSILFFIVIISTGVYSQSGFTEYQTFIDSNITRNFIYSNYDHQSRAVNFTSRINYNQKFGKFNFYIKNYYSSAITQLENKLFRDFDNVKAGAGYYLTDKLNLSANFLGFLYSDEKNILLKGSSSAFYYMSARYDDVIKNAPVYAFLDAGYKNENQTGEFNKGMSIRGELDISNLELSEYFFNSYTRFGYENLDPRINNYLVTRLQVDRSFSNNLAFNSFDGFFSRNKKDFYFPADTTTKQQFGVENNIQKRSETLIRIFDRFDYTISDKVTFYLTVNPYYRDIIKENLYIPFTLATPPGNYDTRIQELSVNGDAALNFESGSLLAQLRLSYFERNEKHLLYNSSRINSIFVSQKEKQEAVKNNHSSRFLAGGNFFYDISDRNRLELSGFASLLKYDTPSEDNFDDRDELNFLVYLAHRYNNRKNLELRTVIDMNLFHTVYIFSQKSSNNNWNRVLRLTSQSYFNPSKKFRTINTFSVLANYTVYDFEDLLSEVNSYTFRQFNLKDSTIYNFTDKLAFKLYAEVKLYERGELNWAGFSLNPDSYIEDKIINPELFYYFSKYIAVSGGFRFFEQRRFRYENGEREFDSWARTSGPLVKLRVDLSNYSLIEIIGSYDYYTYSKDLPSSSNGNLYLNVLWNF